MGHVFRSKAFPVFFPLSTVCSTAGSRIRNRIGSVGVGRTVVVVGFVGSTAGNMLVVTTPAAADEFQDSQRLSKW